MFIYKFFFTFILFLRFIFAHDLIEYEYFLDLFDS